jgi:hypothetical protein
MAEFWRKTLNFALQTLILASQTLKTGPLGGGLILKNVARGH